MADTTTHVALLRGINVGGHNRLAMADLRAVLEDLGHADVRTYIQSGNAVFTSERRDADGMAAELTQRLEADFDLSPTVMVRTAAELTAIAEANPYPDQAAADPKTVHVGFLSAEPADPSFSLDLDSYAPEQLAIGDRVVYLHLPGGIGRGRLFTDLDRRMRDVEMTVRNWRTVVKLREMTR